VANVCFKLTGIMLALVNYRSALLNLLQHKHKSHRTVMGHNWADPTLCIFPLPWSYRSYTFNWPGSKLSHLNMYIISKERKAPFHVHIFVIIKEIIW